MIAALATVVSLATAARSTTAGCRTGARGHGAARARAPVDARAILARAAGSARTAAATFAAPNRRPVTATGAFPAGSTTRRGTPVAAGIAAPGAPVVVSGPARTVV